MQDEGECWSGGRKKAGLSQANAGHRRVTGFKLAGLAGNLSGNNPRSVWLPLAYRGVIQAPTQVQ